MRKIGGTERENIGITAVSPRRKWRSLDDRKIEAKETGRSRPSVDYERVDTSAQRDVNNAVSSTAGTG
jgi:hypothetical protein